MTTRRSILAGAGAVLALAACGPGAQTPGGAQKAATTPRGCGRHARQPRNQLPVNAPRLGFVRNPRTGKTHFVTAAGTIRDLKGRVLRMESIASPTVATLSALPAANRVVSIEEWALAHFRIGASPALVGPMLAVLGGYIAGVTRPEEARLVTLAASLGVRERNSVLLEAAIAKAEAMGHGARARRWRAALEQIGSGAEPSHRRHRNWAKRRADTVHPIGFAPGPPGPRPPRRGGAANPCAPQR